MDASACQNGPTVRVWLTDSEVYKLDPESRSRFVDLSREEALDLRDEIDGAISAIDAGVAKPEPTDHYLEVAS